MHVFTTVVSAIYTALGLSGFVAFLILGNSPGCVWAFASAIINALLTHLLWLKYKNNLEEWYSIKELYPIALVGFIGFAVGIMGIAYHSTIEIMLKKPILPISQSEIIPIVWAFVTAKSGLILNCTIHAFTRTQEDVERSDLVSSEQTNDEAPSIAE